MNDLIQNGLVLLVFIASAGYLARKYFWKSTKTSKSDKACGSSGCGCA